MMYFVVPMPLNKDAQGPETDESKITNTVFMVMNEYFECISTYETEEEALYWQNEFNQST